MKLRSLPFLFLLALLAACGRASADECAPLAPYGLPVSTAPETDTITLCRHYFITHYDRGRVAPRWVAYALTHDQMVAVGRSAIHRASAGIDFQSDPMLDAGGFRSPTTRDFARMVLGGLHFDRGHLLPAGSMKWSPEAYRATFVVSNIAPQVHEFNAGPWARLEAQERGWACDHGAAYSVTGVIFGPRTVGHRRINVPSHFWKLIYVPAGGGHIVAFLMRNVRSGASAVTGIVTVAQLEAAAGLRFPARIEGATQDGGFWRFDYPKGFRCIETPPR